MYVKFPSTKTVGTTAGTLAAGNDPRIVGAAQLSALSTVATSGSASDLSTGTLADARLPNVGTANTYGGSTQIPVITTDSKGRITGITLAAAVASGLSSNGTVAAGNVAVYADTTGNVVRDGGTLAAVALSGSASDLSTGTLPAARLPQPSTTTLGGVRAKASTASQFLISIGTDGIPTAAQPAFSDISGTVAGTQSPPLSGDVTSNAGSTTTTIAAGVVSFAKLATAAISAVSDLFSNVASKLISVNTLWGAQTFVNLTDSATISVDMNTFLNAKVTLGGNRTLGAPTNAKEGQSGIIQVIQDGTGSRTLAYASAWDFGANGVPTLSTGANKIDVISYVVVSTTGPVIKAYFGKSA